jgi:hypothetical protein
MPGHSFVSFFFFYMAFGAGVSIWAIRRDFDLPFLEGIGLHIYSILRGCGDEVVVPVIAISWYHYKDGCK